MSSPPHPQQPLTTSTPTSPSTKPHPTLVLLTEYHSKLQSQQSECTLNLSSIKQDIHKQFQQQLSVQFSIFEKQFYKQKHNLDSQLKTVEYYLQNFVEKHAMNPKQNNLYPLFNQIDRKMGQNKSFLSSNLHFSFQYPSRLQAINSQISTIKGQILQRQLEQIRLFLQQNENIRKYCNKELKQIQEIHEGWGKVFQGVGKQVGVREVKVVGSVEQVLFTLKMTKHIQKVDIGIKSTKGKMDMEHYKSLISSLLPSKNLLTYITIKLMDMQFEQQKCQLIKSFVKQLKVLRNFKLQNYYKENKLGMFEDFNWSPLKKNTHILGKVWC